MDTKILKLLMVVRGAPLFNDNAARPHIMTRRRAAQPKLNTPMVQSGYDAHGVLHTFKIDPKNPDFVQYVRKAAKGPSITRTLTRKQFESLEKKVKIVKPVSVRHNTGQLGPYKQGTYEIG